MTSPVQFSRILGRAVAGLVAASLVGLAEPRLAVAAVQQQGDDPVPEDTVRLAPVNVTATRSARRNFDTPSPVSVVGRRAIREQAANNIGDLFSTLPGLDVVGVGISQVRPSIRGQRGQRILLLEDGMRLNNSRRQQEFGEVPSLIDLSALERVEIVRGPASVLYGTDAIGGVVNMITRLPELDGLHGGLGYRYSTQGDQNRVQGTITGRYGKLGFLVRGSFRDGGSYDAPAGSFGDITLEDEAEVFDTGVQDESVDLYLSYAVTPRHEVFAKYARYRADSTGFGWVDPDAYAPDQPIVQILYPFQNFDKLSFGYRGQGLGSALADQVDVTFYTQDNDRRFDNNVLVTPFPGASIDVQTRNFTDVTTFGGRIELKKIVSSRVMLTYGLDGFHDDSRNTDTSTTTMVGFGPFPMVKGDSVALIPYATYRSIGGFVQGDMELTDRATLILGVRYQSIRAATKETPGRTDPLITETDQTLVGAANLAYRITDQLSAVASVGRAFRSPNLIERFFNGMTPEGNGFQLRNTNLKPETSVNVDLGLRFENGRVALEGFYFRNHIRDGIRVEPTGEEMDGFPVYQNVNVEKLRFQGVELAGEVLLPYGFSLAANYSHLSSKDVIDETNPVGDTYSNKVNGEVRYRGVGDRVWIAYQLRHNGARKDVDLGTSPIGAVLPAFTVHSVYAGVTVWRRGLHTQRLGLALTNLTNELYAEFSNASFFRPAPRRGVTLTWDMSF